MSDKKQTFIFDVSTQWDSLVAVVDVDFDEVDTLRRAYADLKKQGITLVDLSVWGDVVLYEKNGAVREWIGGEGFDDDLDNVFYVRVDSAPEFEKITERVRLSFSKMVVSGTSVYWTLAPKHHEGTIETAALFENDLT